MILACYNPKGGVGKTTTAVNVAALLAYTGRSVLLVDLEADHNASISVGIRPPELGTSIVDVLLNGCQPADAVQAIATIPNLFVITGSPALADMDVRLRHVRHPERRLADILRPLAHQFDMVMIDSPSGYSVIALSVPFAAQHLLVPIRADYLSLESVAQLLRWYRERSLARKGVARMTGMILTMVDYRRQATGEIVDIIRRHNRRGVFRTEIPDDPRIAEAPSHGLPLVAYTASRGLRAYEQLTEEIVMRVSRRR